MLHKPPSPRRCRITHPLCSHRHVLNPVFCFFSVALAAGLGGAIFQGYLIWIANGVLLAYLLLAPRNRWPALIVAAILGHLIGTALVHNSWQINLVDTPLDLGEALFAAALLRHRSAQLPNFTKGSYLLRFLAVAVVAAPLSNAFLAALIQMLWLHASFSTTLYQWFASDSLGICVVTPACVAIFRTRISRTFPSLRPWLQVLPFAAITIAILCQSKAPLEFLLYPMLVLILLRLGLGWAAACTLFAAAAASWFTIHGMGPFVFRGSSSALDPAVTLQLFIACAMFMIYSISAVLESRRAAERRLQHIAAIHKVVTDNSRDVLIIADFEGNRSFISASGEEWGGWTHNEILRRKSLDLVHPDDRSQVIAALAALREGKDGAMIECRVSKRDGSYVWVEASLRAIRDPVTRVPTGVLNNVREITERKLADQAREFQHSLIHAIHSVSPDGILVVDENENVVSCNSRFGEVWNISLPSSLPGHLDHGLRMHDGAFLAQAVALTKDPEAFLRRVDELYAHRDESERVQIELKDGRTLERYTTSLRTASGQYLGRVWFFRDITDQKLAEQRLREAYHAVETLAITDALTGLANRRQFDQCLATEWRRGLRDARPLSLLLIDADRFKTYNDTYGHLRGDSCLQQIAASARDVVARPGDLVARFGGEEFAVILPNTPSIGAMQMAHGIRDAVLNRRLPHSANPLGVVTVSVGCATLVPQLGLQAPNLIDLADKALYQAKHAGRNQVCNNLPGDASEPDPNDPSALIALKSA